MKTTATPLSTLAIALLGLVGVLGLPGRGRAQAAIGPTPEGNYVSPYTGREFNNPMSATLDSIITSRQRMDRIMNTALMNQALLNAAMDAEFRKIGERIIAEGRATTDVPPMDIESLRWLLNVDRIDDEHRPDAEALRDEHAAYLRFAADRGADGDELGDILALAMVVGFENLTGRPTTDRQRRSIAEGARDDLLSDAVFQGKGARGAVELASRWRSATLAVVRESREAKTEAEMQEIRESASQLLGGLWPDPVEAIEPTLDGFVDRGRRIVAEGSASSTFARELTDEAVAREEIEREYIAVPLDLSPLLGVESKDYETRKREAEEARIAERIAASRAFRAKVRAFGFDDNDLAASGATAIALLWPEHAGQTVTERQRAQAYSLMAEDVLTSPDFQRLGDLERQRIFDGWAVRCMERLASLDTAKAEVAETRARVDRLADDPGHDALTLLLESGAADAAASAVESAKAQVAALLVDLFSPRDFDRIALRVEGFVVTDAPK